MRFLRLLLAASALLLLWPPTAHAQQPAPPDTTTLLDLPLLLAEAQARNPLLQAARLDAAAQATRPDQVGALPDPTVMAGYRPLAVGGPDGVVPGQLMVQQMIPYPGTLALREQAATYGARAAARDADALGLQLAYEIQDAYFELYRIQQQDRLIAQFQAQLDDFEEASAVRYEVGQGPQQAILKAQLERHTLARRRLDLAAARRTQLERLARLTNRPRLAASTRVVLTAPAATVAADTTLTAALLHRPEVAALHLRRQQADAEVDLARKAYRPDFMVSAGFMDMMRMDAPARPLRNLTDRFALQAGIVLPLRQAPRDAALEEARLRRARLDAEMEALQTEIATEVNDLRTRLQEDQRALALYRDVLLPQAETTLASTLSAYTTGQTDFLDLLDAERMRFDLQMDYEETHARYLQTRALLGRTLGLPAATLTQNLADQP